MFVSKSHLPQLLKGEYYHSPEVHRREVEELFRPGWHAVGHRSQLKPEGGYLTLSLFGTPVLVCRRGDEVRAYLNICTHRFSTLTDKPQGCFEGRIKCQYHGWEYNEEGSTCRIPDAQHFRPLKKGQLGLREFRCETLGELVFVCLDEDAPPLREYLPQLYIDLIEKWFTADHDVTSITKLTLNCNWKVATENILESYHVACVHPKSFQSYPQPENCTHEFFEDHDHYTHDFENEPRYAKPERLLSRWTSREPDYTWHHLLKYPNVVLGGAGPFHYCQFLLPTAPGQCESLVITCQWSGRAGGWMRPWNRFFLRRYGSRAAKQVQLEDADIYPSIQRGISSRDQPHSRGYVSAREERIFAFQRYWLLALGMEATPSSGLDVFEPLGSMDIHLA